MAKASILIGVRPQFFTNTAAVASGHKVYFYQPGTTTLKDTYTTSSKSVANPNPIILDSAGRPDNNGTPIDVYLDGSYKVVLKTSDGTQIWVVDPFTGLGQNTSTVTKTSNYTLTEDDRDKLILVDASSGNITITLMAAATAGDGFFFNVKKIDSSANTVTVQANGAETIDGVNARTLSAPYDYMSGYSNGTAWYRSVISSSTFSGAGSNGNPVISLTDGPSTVNYWSFSASNTGSPISAAAIGSDTNISVSIAGKGTGEVSLGQATTTGIKLAADQPIIDSSGNEYIKFSKTASAVNELTISNAATSTGPTLTATGGDTNIVMNFQMKGAGTYNFLGSSTVQSIARFYEQTSNGSNFISLTVPASVTANRTITLPDSDISGFLIQRVSSLSNTLATGTTVLPWDNTIPQNTEGDQYMSVSITPKTATSVLVIEVVAQAANSNAASNVTMALFQDSTANALAAISETPSIASGVNNLKLSHIMTSGTTSATTFKVRIGGNGAGTTSFNGSAGTQLFGGVCASSIVIYEYSS